MSTIPLWRSLRIILSTTYQGTSEGAKKVLLLCSAASEGDFIVLQSTRLDDQSAGITEIMHNKVVRGPLRDPCKMRDVGCGTGVITRQFGTQCPSVTVYGIGISPVPPSS